MKMRRQIVDNSGNTLLPCPWRIRIYCPADHLHNSTHSRGSEHSWLPLDRRATPTTTLTHNSCCSTFCFRNLSKALGEICSSKISPDGGLMRSEEHTSELQSHSDLVCRLLLEKKKTKQ